MSEKKDSKPRDKDSLANIIIVALAVCLVCSVIVSTAAVALKPQQLINKELDLKQNILRAAGMLPENSSVDELGRGVDELFTQFRARAVDLTTGQFVDSVDVGAYEPLKAARDPQLSLDLSSEQDTATLGRRENISIVYMLEDADGGLEKLIIPVRGYGLWGTLFGYLAIESDLQTIGGLGFYTHKETPGLGGEVDNPKWKALWPGVKIYRDGAPQVDLVKTRSAPSSPMAAYEVDALSGATMTTRGVENLINFWTGDLGFGPFIKNLAGS